MRKNNVSLILILLVSMFVSCQNSAGEGSHLRGNDGILLNNNLTKKDMNKLKDFVKKSSEYANTLVSIYNRYISASNDVKTYSGCSKDKMSSCDSEEPSKIRIAGVAKLNDPELVKGFKKLADLIRGANSQTLDNAIKHFEEDVKAALNKTGTDHPVGIGGEIARKAADSYLKVIDVAIEAYIDALATVTTSSSEFNTAVGKFAEAARRLADKNGVASVGAIDYAIGAIILQKDVNKATEYAEKFGDETGQAFSYAIKALNATYRGDTK
ncbi:hypothetical protein CR532_04485 (plasmid) [Candidatus Borreliella tachyglossi]|uniref:Lipoprotein n=1 Tax=Candidatus Borreliella tachyglossi TaxID=1964448 RepID=A0A2S1LY67_9SPIR|nr:hypothetical protein [Candidatus Borreliella tachyglossi]AWG43257.1 hypothetical protein CR532_04485 [Candidatus Borreliella tachyglossi]